LFRSSIKTGRAKRNATFPGGIATTYISQYSGSSIQTPPVKCEPTPPAAETPAAASEEIPALECRKKTRPTDGRSIAEPPLASPEASLSSTTREEKKMYKKINIKPKIIFRSSVTGFLMPTPELKGLILPLFLIKLFK
jgi:hypothetical protein